MKSLLTNLRTWLYITLKSGKHKIVHLFYSILYRGFGKYCPVCGRPCKKFLPYGTYHRQNARCPYCESLERHRFMWIFLQTKTNLFDEHEKQIIHVAPEACFEHRFRKLLGKGYVTADLYDPQVDMEMDVTQIKLQDNSIDIILCSHVLEHVQDDRKAMNEFFRILKQNGWAILSVPIKGQSTFDDPSIVDPKERLKIFGQSDHVRIYGEDFIDRLRAVGFHVEKYRYLDLVTEDEVNLFGLNESCGYIYYCSKI